MSANENMVRRTFLKGVAAAGASLAAGLRNGPALLAEKSPNEVIGVKQFEQSTTRQVRNWL